MLKPSYVRRRMQPRAIQAHRLDPKGLPRLTSSTEAHPLLKSYIGDGTQEHAILIGLNSHHGVVGHKLIHKGDSHQTQMEPRHVLREALLMGATGFVIAHNHPTGPVRPSGPDIQVTELMKQAGDTVGVSLLDHVVFSHHECYSMRANDDKHPIWNPRRRYAPDPMSPFDPFDVRRLYLKPKL